MLASYASSNLSGSYASVDGVGIQNAFIGGFLLLFGARLASGCTRYCMCKQTHYLLSCYCSLIQWPRLVRDRAIEYVVIC